ncbi:hypothetical protein NQ315_016298 [Exocentrus adspersus]|uniref:Uncharacterized protein n=1 Tax=Exocentrus adspersus TaxID=1586481 RepID=A0AAV8VPU2_9CUCU|nr:hypothetical protein NQ315_016298 [Exocentrus adspersus]
MDMCSKRSILNRQYKKVQQEILQLNLKLQQKSKEFVNKIKTMDNELKKLYSQFDGGTLMTILSELNSKLLAAEDEETVLQRSYQELENTPVDLSGYEKLKAIEAVISEKFQERTFEEIEQILANKRKNIQFLVGEYNKFLDKLNLYCN